MNRQNLNVLRKQYSARSYTSFLSANENQQLVIHSVTAYNGIEANNNLGIAKTVNESQWSLFNQDASVDYSDLIKDGQPVDMFTTVNGEGVIISSKDQFSLAGFHITQGATGGVYAFEYWNGSAWTSLVLIQSPDFSSTGNTVMMFSAPADWTAVLGLYEIRLTATTAGSQNVVIDEMLTAEVLAYRENILPFGELAVLFENERQLLLQQGESIIGYFYLPWTSHTMEASYQINP